MRHFDARIVSSQAANWGGVRVEIIERELTGRAMLRYCLDEHVVVLELSHGASGERFLDGRAERFSGRPGLLSFRPAGCDTRGWSAGVGRIRYAMLFIAPSLLDWSKEDVDPDQCRFRPVSDLRNAMVLQAARALMQECIAPGICGRLYAESLGLVMLTQLIRHCSTAANLSRIPRGGLPSFRLRRVTEFIESRLEGDLDLSTLAHVAELSPSQFIRAFRRSTGTTPMQYVLGWRIEHAKKLFLDVRLSIADIASQCGFADQSHFTNQFRRVVGVTPAVFRSDSLAYAERQPREKRGMLTAGPPPVKVC